MTDLPSLPFVNYISNGKGKRYARFRSKQTGLINLPGLPGDPGFYAAYDDALQLRARLLAGKAATADDSVRRYLDRT